jgi:hypothetical protein
MWRESRQKSDSCFTATSEPCHHARYTAPVAPQPRHSPICTSLAATTCTACVLASSTWSFSACDSDGAWLVDACAQHPPRGLDTSLPVAEASEKPELLPPGWGVLCPAACSASSTSPLSFGGSSEGWRAL